jgi:hypothetical protein
LNVKIEPIGIIREYIPDVQLEFNLGDYATLADLYHEIGERLGDELPEAIWNQKKRRFRGPVLLSSNEQLIKDETTRLYDGQKIQLRRFLVGG